MHAKFTRLIQLLERLARRRIIRRLALLAALLLALTLVILVYRTYRPVFHAYSAAHYASPQATATPADTASPTHPPTVVTLTPTVSPTARPPLTLIWSPESEQVYLRDGPNGNSLALLDNGTPVTLGEEAEAGGATWVQVTGAGFSGWVARLLVATIQQDRPVAYLSSEEGAYLRAEPQGMILAWLPDGTPGQIIETVEANGVAWVHVVLPDERTGWVVQRLLNTAGP